MTEVSLEKLGVKSAEEYQELCDNLDLSTKFGVYKDETGAVGLLIGNPQDFKIVQKRALSAGYNVTHGCANTALNQSFLSHDPKCRGCYSCNADEFERINKIIWEQHADERAACEKWDKQMEAKYGSGLK